jgi:hypothetical protein
MEKKLREIKVVELDFQLLQNEDGNLYASYNNELNDENYDYYAITNIESKNPELKNYNGLNINECRYFLKIPKFLNDVAETRYILAKSFIKDITVIHTDKCDLITSGFIYRPHCEAFVYDRNGRLEKAPNGVYKEHSSNFERQATLEIKNGYIIDVFFDKSLE